MDLESLSGRDLTPKTNPDHPAYEWDDFSFDMHPDDWNRAIWRSLQKLISTQAPAAAPPPPVVHVEPPDLSAIVTAVQGISPGVYPAQIADAIRGALAPMRDDNGLRETLLQMGKALETMEFRLRGTGRSFGAGISGPITMQTAPGTAITTATQGAGTATVTSVGASVSSVTLLAANTGRKQVVFFNDSTAAAYVKFGDSASTTSFTYKIATQASLEPGTPVFLGDITAVWDSAAGSMRITELT